MTRGGTWFYRAMHKRIVHLALADARGHLMRAHLLRELLARSGTVVDIVTTQQAGAQFLASMGTPSNVLPGRFRMEVDARHQLLLGRTRRRFFRYAVADMRNDIAVLRSLTAGADLVVNDSFHPALLAAHRVLPRARVVHLHGDNLKRTVAESSRPFRVERWLSRGFAEIVHTLEPVHGLAHGRVVHLPPLVAAPRRPAHAMRAKAGGPIAAVYLNPHYRDPSIALLVEKACAARGLVLQGVSEAFARRPGWCAADPWFLDVIAAADAFLSGAGMGALEQARVTGTPLLCVLGRQEEQTRNAIERGLAYVELDDPDAEQKLAQALDALPKKRDVDASAEIARVHAMWTQTFAMLLKGASDEDCTRHRDQQSARRRRPRRHVPLPTARALADADARALIAR